MANEKSVPVMPEHEAETLRGAYSDYRSAVDPHDPWTNRLLASTVRSAHSVGWSRRTIASALGLTREKVDKLSGWEPELDIEVQEYARNASFPPSAVAAHRQIEARVRARRLSAERRLTDVVRSAHSCGWPYPALGAIIGITRERVRQFAEAPFPATASEIMSFTPYRSKALVEDPPRVAPPVIDAAARKRLTALAATARTARRAPGARRIGKEDAERTLAARKASEELSDLIKSLKAEGATWPELDRACGYQPNGARARAARHGYGKLPPSVSAYKGS